MANFVVHQSSIKTWRRCKRQYYYTYIMNLTRRRQASPLLRGTVVHEMIEKDILKGEDRWAPLVELEERFKKMFPEEQEFYGDMPGEIRDIMTGYFKWYKKDPLTPMPVEGKLAEHKFEVQLTPSITLRGKIDAVAKDRMKRKWLVDHKTHKTLPKGDIKYSDIQSALYVWALEQSTNLKLDGVAWNYLRWKRPATPELLKKGDMSRRAIDTTWDIYEAALKREGLDPADYEDMYEKLQHKEQEFFVRSYLPVNKTILSNLLEEAQVTAREIKRKAGVDKTRTIDRHCDWCSFYVLCQADLRGFDTADMMKMDFMERKDHTGEEAATITDE